MHSVIVCRSCGRTMNKDFIYCPWCGVSSLAEPSYGKIIEVTCARLEAQQIIGRDERINKLEHSLDLLEKDLSSLISQYAGH